MTMRKENQLSTNAIKRVFREQSVGLLVRHAHCSERFTGFPPLAFKWISRLDFRLFGYVSQSPVDGRFNLSAGTGVMGAGVSDDRFSSGKHGFEGKGGRTQ